MKFTLYGVLLFCVMVGSVCAQETDKKMEKIHQHLSAKCFNTCWTYIDKKDGTPEDTENMILLANASLWHWKQRSDCTPLKLSIGYWQVSRVYALAGEYDMAKRFGEQCLKIGTDGKLSPFCVGYAYEALARAELVGGDRKCAADHLAKARLELERVTDKGESELLKADLDGIAKSLSEDPKK